MAVLIADSAGEALAKPKRRRSNRPGISQAKGPLLPRAILWKASRQGATEGVSPLEPSARKLSGIRDRGGSLLRGFVRYIAVTFMPGEFCARRR